MTEVLEDYKIPAGYQGVLYAGDIFYYYGRADEYMDTASGASVFEDETISWYEDLDDCISQLERYPHSDLFQYPYQDYKFARVVVDGIELDGEEDAGETGWNYNRLAWPVYLGELIENPDSEEI